MPEKRKVLTNPQLTRRELLAAQEALTACIEDVDRDFKDVEGMYQARVKIELILGKQDHLRK